MTVPVSRERLVQLYLDYSEWSRRFPAIRDVQLIREEENRTVIQVDHGDGPLLGSIKRLSDYEIELGEHQTRFDVRVLNRFERVGDSTKCVIRSDVRLKGPYALLAPFLGGVVRRRLQRLLIEPILAAAEGASLSA